MDLNRLLSAVAAALLLSCAGVMAADVDYAPESADLIVRVNGAKFCGGKAWAAVKSSPQYPKMERDVHGVLAKSGLTLDDVLNTDICLFYDTRKEDRSVDMVARNPKISSDTALAWLDSERNGTAEKTKIDGREARVIKQDGVVCTAIVLGADLVQMSIRGEAAGALVSRPRSALAAAVDPGSAVSVAYKGSSDSFEVLSRNVPQLAPFLVGLDIAMAKIDEDDGVVRLDAELRFADVQNAQNVESQLNMLLVMGMMSWQKKEPEKVEILQKFRITRDGTRVFVNFVCPLEKLNGAFLN